MGPEVLKYKTDPVGERECERASPVAKIQGNVNLVVDQACGKFKGQK